MAEGGHSRKMRCAIYTRKSTEEGLEQEFNSLDAQYEACSAYIVSQRHEGWVQNKERYDDGGFSGGSMERPGLKRLMADVAAGKVDVIVVYKVDRLTRSLADFAKIVEILDERSASFVSVTQAFNTTTSMGRLTLNVLLSFAQFEREVTGERIRDKIAASKKKGMWMGGIAPLGYRIENRSLVVAVEEAAIVRHIFQRYLALGTGTALIEDLQADGYRTKRYHNSLGPRGGVPFSRGALFHILGNPIYVGKVSHHGAVHDGLHEPIIDKHMWDAVQAMIAENRVVQSTRQRSAISSPLAGLIVDGHGRRMSPSHAVKKGKRYRYYITHGSELRGAGQPAWRIPAFDIELAVVENVRERLLDGAAVRSMLPSDIDAANLADALIASRSLASELNTSTGRRSILPTLLMKIRSDTQQLCIHLNPDGLTRALHHPIHTDAELLTIIAPAMKMRSGNATKLVIGNSAPKPKGRDEQLIALLVEANEARDLVLRSPGIAIKDQAQDRGLCRSRLAKLVRLSWLSPKLVKMIMTGKQPASITSASLLNTALPLSWTEQEAMLLAG